MEMKPYIAIHKPTGHRTLVEAKSKTSARRAAADHDYEVRSPTMRELLDLGAQHIKPITANPQDEQPETGDGDRDA